MPSPPDRDVELLVSGCSRRSRTRQNHPKGGSEGLVFLGRANEPRAMLVEGRAGQALGESICNVVRSYTFLQHKHTVPYEVLTEVLTYVNVSCELLIDRGFRYI